jgi:hypothetical protein
MTFSKQDAVTFVIGLVVALVFTVGEALANAEAIRDVGIETWGINLAVALSVSAGRYLTTKIVEKGFIE